MGKGRYISNAERESIVILDALAGTIDRQVKPHLDKMGKEVAKRIRTAMTNLEKGLVQYVDELSHDDKLRLNRDSRNTRLIVATNAYKPKEDKEAEQRQEILDTLAEFAMGHNCRGCKKDGETCPLKHALAMADVPYTTTEPENCPYEQ
jgi:hypothetical protein